MWFKCFEYVFELCVEYGFKYILCLKIANYIIICRLQNISAKCATHIFGFRFELS